MTTGPLTDRGRRTREQVLDAARTVFEERGYDGTRMSDIARAAGVSHGTVYTYFGAKDDVLRAACTRFVAQVLDEVRVPDDQRADPVHRVREGHRRFLATYIAHARMLAVVEQAAIDDRYFRDVVEQLRTMFVQRAEGALRQFQAEGAADRGLDPALVAPALVGMVEAFARRWHDHPGKGQRYDPEQVVAVLSDLWIRATGLKGVPR